MSPVQLLELEADVFVCAWVPPDFAAVGQAYLDFTPTTDAEVRRALELTGPSAIAQVSPVGIEPTLDPF